MGPVELVIGFRSALGGEVIDGLPPARAAGRVVAPAGDVHRGLAADDPFAPVAPDDLGPVDVLGAGRRVLAWEGAPALTAPGAGGRTGSGSAGQETIQLENSSDSAKPFQTVPIRGTYRGGADTFLRVERWEGGRWLAFPLPTKTDQSGQFTAYVEFGQPGRYQLRVLHPESGVTSKQFVLVIKG